MTAKKNPRRQPEAIEVLWGGQWERPPEWHRLTEHTISARVTTRHGASVMVKFRNTCDHTHWRVVTGHIND